MEEVHFADSKFGRVLNFTETREGLEKQNFLNKDLATLELCTKPVSLDSKSLDFIYCIDFQRKKEETLAAGELNLFVFEFGQEVHTVTTDFEVFIKDRWAVDRFGDWEGQIQYKRGNLLRFSMKTGDNLFVTFQPISETEFILRPDDIAHTVSVEDEVFVLKPENKDITILEESAHPYINFVYISSEDGNRRVEFNTHLKSDDHIEGNVILVRSDGLKETLATFSLNKR